MTKNKDVVYRQAKPKEKIYRISDGGGMFMEVTPAGGKYWRLMYRYAGKQKTLALGVYPTIGLADARQRRDEAKRLIANDLDPSEVKKAQKSAKQEEAESEANTFEKVAREWHSNKLLGWRENTARDYLHRLEKDIFPEIGNMPIAGISRKHLIAALRKIEDRGAVEIAGRLLNTCEQVFRYAVQNEYVQINIATDMKGILKPARKRHFASIATDELPAFLRVMNENKARLYLPTRIALNLMLLTFLRTSELIETPWEEINLETGEWIVPWYRMKRGKLAINPVKTDHHVFLSKQSLDLLKELHPLTGRGKYLFPNQREPDRPMSNGAILQALKRMGYRKRMTGHGFRSLAMTCLKQELGYRHEVVDRQLAHAQQNKVDAAYDRALFLKERKKMMQDWADYLDALRKGAEVLPFQTKVA